MLFGENEAALFRVRQKLSAQEYASGALLVEQELSPTGRPGVRAAACAAGAALSASTAPLSLREYGTMWIPLLFTTAFAALGLWMFFAQPQRRARERQNEFCGAPLLGLETEIALFRDFVVIKNEFEELQEYWTEFSSCLETPAFTALAGTGPRRLLLIRTQELPQEERERLSEFLQNTFASAYRRVERKGGNQRG